MNRVVKLDFDKTGDVSSVPAKAFWGPSAEFDLGAPPLFNMWGPQVAAQFAYATGWPCISSYWFYKYVFSTCYSFFSRERFFEGLSVYCSLLWSGRGLSGQSWCTNQTLATSSGRLQASVNQSRQSRWSRLAERGRTSENLNWFFFMFDKIGSTQILIFMKNNTFVCKCCKFCFCCYIVMKTCTKLKAELKLICQN